MLQNISQMNMKRITNPKGDAGCLTWVRESHYWCRGAWPLPAIFWLLLLKADALTCVSVTRRFDLRASGPTALRWQGSDVGLEQRQQLTSTSNPIQLIFYFLKTISNIKYYIKIILLKIWIIKNIYHTGSCGFKLGKHGHKNMVLKLIFNSVNSALC